MNRRVRKAVFPVGGMGTRFLPATKANPKEMMTVVDEPLIQYAAKEAVEAGIEVLIFVTGRNKRSIADHFDKAYELESELAAKGKDETLELVRDIVPPHVSCVYMRQSEPLGLGHAVGCARPIVDDEPFAVLLADDLIDGDDKGCLSQMVEVYEQHQCGVIGVMPVAEDEVSNYGIIRGTKGENSLWKIEGIVEKPKPVNAPSNIGVVGRYILEPTIFDCLQQTGKGAGGEIQLTDALALQLETETLLAYPFTGKRYDCGSKLGYLQANVEYALKHPDLNARFREYLKNLVLGES